MLCVFVLCVFVLCVFVLWWGCVVVGLCCGRVVLVCCVVVYSCWWGCVLVYSSCLVLVFWFDVCVFCVAVLCGWECYIYLFHFIVSYLIFLVYVDIAAWVHFKTCPVGAGLPTVG